MSFQEKNYLEITPIEEMQGVPLGKLTKDTSKCVSTNSKLRNGNVLIYGTSGSGKVNSFVDPYLYKAIDRKESFISTDAKGEIFSDTYHYASMNDYTVKTFNCNEPEKGNSIHLLKFVGTDQEQADLITNTIIQNTSEDRGKTETVPFWEDMQHQLLMSCILYITYEYEEKHSDHLAVIEGIRKEEISEEEKRKKIDNENLNWKKKTDPIHGYGSIGRVYDFISEGLYHFVADEEQFKPEEKQVLSLSHLDYVADQFADALTINNAHPAKHAWLTFQSFPEQHKVNSLNTLAKRLRIFQKDTIRRMLSVDDIDIEKIGNEKTAIYMIVNQLETDKRIISALFMTMIIKGMMESAKRNEDRRLKNKTHIIMDEYYSIGNIPDIEQYLCLCRSYGMNIIMILQGRSQLMQRHPDKYKIIESNFAIICKMDISKYIQV